MYWSIALKNMKRVIFKMSGAVANQGESMEVDTISKNGRSSKSQMSRRKYLCNFVVAALAVGAAFTSCDGNGDDGGNGNGDGVGVVTQISATIDNASQFSDIVQIKLVAVGPNDCGALAEAEIKNGRFTLQLPETVPESFLYPISEAAYTLSFGIPEILTYSVNNAKVLVYGHHYWIIGCFSSGKMGTSFDVRSRNNSEKIYIYTDSDVNVSGSGTRHTVGGPDLDVSVDLKFKKGWNVYYSIVTLPPSFKIEYRTSPAIGGDWQWYILGYAGDAFSNCL